MKNMIEIAAKHHGTLEGYVIPVETGRDDARISFDGMTLHLSRDEAQKLYDEFEHTQHHVNHFDEKAKNTYRFWWD
jgi:hypothetical protein